MIGFFVVLTIIVAFTAVFVIWPFCDKYKEHRRRENDNVPVVKISYEHFLTMYGTNPRRWRIRPCGTMENDFYALARDDVWDDRQTQLFYRDDTQIQEWMSDHYTGFTQVVFSIWDFVKYRRWFKNRNKEIQKSIILNQIKESNKALEDMIAQHCKDKFNGTNLILNLFDAIKEDDKNA